MPYFPDQEAPDFNVLAQGQEAVTPTDIKAASNYTSIDTRAPLSSLGGAVGLVGASGLDLADTVASSVIPGVDRQDVNNTFLNAVGSPGISKWYQENQGAIEVGSTIAGVIAADIATRGLFKQSGAAMSVMRKIPVVRSIAALDGQYANALRLARVTGEEVAARGLTGYQRFLGEGLVFSRLGKGALETSNLKATAGVLGARTAVGLRHNVAMEGIMAATLHTNSVLYSDDMAHNIAWGAAALGIGAGIDSMIGSYTLRKMANSQTVRRLNAAAYDVSGFEAGRIHAASIAGDLLKTTDSAFEHESWMFGGSGGTTDQITSLAIDSAELSLRPQSISDRALTLFGKRAEIATPKMAQAQELLQKVTTQGFPGVKSAGFSTKAEGLGKPLHESLARDPAFLNGIEHIGTTIENMSRTETVAQRNQVLKKRFDRAQQLLNDGGTWTTRRVKDPKGNDIWEQKLTPLKDGEADALRAEIKELHFASSQVPVTMLEPGEWMPLELGEVADGFKTFQPSREGSLGADDVAIWGRPRENPSDPVLGIRSDGDLFLPANGKLDSLTLPDMLSLFHVGNKAVRDMAASGHKLTLGKNPNWFQLDLAEQLLKASGDEAAVQFPGAMTRQTAMVESFAQKVAAVNREATTLRLARRGSENSNLTDVDMYKLRVKYNLPRLTSMQLGQMGTAEHPIDILLSGLKDAKAVRNMSHDELLKGLNDSRQITGLTDKTGAMLSDLHGNSFNFLMDRDGNAIKPIIGFLRPLAPMDWSRDALLVRQISKEIHLTNTLKGPRADPITAALVEAITGDPRFANSRKVMELADDQHRSFVPGFRQSAPQTSGGSLINSLTSRNRRDVDVQVMLDASGLQELKTRVVQETMRNLITGAMGDSITLLNSTRNAASKVLMDQFHTFRPGWELLREPAEVSLPNGKKGFGFTLDHESVLNQKGFKEKFGRDLTKGQALLNPDGTSMVLDELGMDTLNRMQAIHQANIMMKNTLLRSQGLSELKQVPWYVPAPSTKGKYVGFTFDMQDRVVPGMTVIAETPEQLSKMQAELMKSPQWKNGYVNRKRGQVESFMNLWDKAQMGWLEPTTTAIQPKKHNFGRTGGNLLNTNAFNEAMLTMRDSMVKHGDDVMEVLYDDPIKAAMSRSQIARTESEVGSRKAESHSSIYDRYVQNLMGRNALSAKDSFFGDAMGWAERRLNGLLAHTGGALDQSQIYQGLKDYLMTATPGSKNSAARFAKLTEELGPYMPFKSVTQMLERETGSKTPLEVANITSKLSWFEATSRLRWFESMHAVANIGGMLSNMPSVIRALQPKLGETLADAAARNSLMVMKVATPAGHEMIIPSVPKLMWASMKHSWGVTTGKGLAAEEGLADFTKMAISRGYLHQEVAEFNRAWGAVDSKAGWRQFVFGDAGAQASEGAGVFGKAKAKVAQSGGLDKWMGLLSDKSEDFSRAWGMYAGRLVAKANGIEDISAQLDFAHELTNKLIANYDPRSRPEIFQGALGAPIGLFQSYAVNYYQRMFRYVETQDHRALATQMATQSAIFGTASLPGWQALNWAFFDKENGAGDDPVDSMYRRFDHGSADLIMHGTLSNLPKLFGGDGVSLYTRGDSQIRVPGVLMGNPTENNPIADTFGRLWHGMGQAWDMVAGEQQLSPASLAEVASNVVTNRPLGGLLELAAGGRDTDWNGQVVSEVKSASDGIYRALGVRGMQQQNEVEQFYQNKSIMAEQGARKSELNRMTRAAIRRGNFDEVPDLFASYVDSGGDPRYWSKWVKQNFKAALDTRAERQLKQTLTDPRKSSYAQRLLDAGVDTPEAEGGDDYGREAQEKAVIDAGWEGVGEPTGNPLDHEAVETEPSYTGM